MARIRQMESICISLHHNMALFLPFPNKASVSVQILWTVFFNLSSNTCPLLMTLL